jgi:hypothetical protein
VRSSRSNARAAAGLAAGVALALCAAPSVSAHRTDEYLQAARLAIDPGGVQIELDLTPGIAVAAGVLADLDGDRDGSISSAEEQRCVRRVLSAIALEIDGSPLSVKVVDSAFPAVEMVRQGNGTIRMRFAAPVPGLAPGAHQLRYRNAYRSDIGVYLANALVPASARIDISDQQRDVDQRELRIDYLLRAGSATLPVRGVVFSIAAGLLVLAVLLRRCAELHSRKPLPLPQ